MSQFIDAIPFILAYILPIIALKYTLRRFCYLMDEDEVPGILFLFTFVPMLNLFIAIISLLCVFIVFNEELIDRFFK